MLSSTFKVLTRSFLRDIAVLCLLTTHMSYLSSNTSCSTCDIPCAPQPTGTGTVEISKKKNVDCCAPRFEGLTTFIPRSQGDNTARELVGWQRQLFICYENSYAAIASSIEYTRSFDTECIAKHLFSTECLTFLGSDYTNRKETDIVADYFGLPTDFRGTLSIQPRIENVIIDLNLYFGLQDSGPGLFLWINAPIVHTRWSLGLDECVSCAPKFRGCTQFPSCYMFSGTSYPLPFQDSDCPTPLEPVRTPPNCPVNSNLDVPLELRNGNCTTQSIREALSGKFTFGDMLEPWKFGRFSFCPKSKTALADIDVMFGWNIIQNDYAHFGLYGVSVIPTGNRPKARYIFEPMVGDGKHWKLGGGMSGHISLFPNTDECGFNMGLYAYGRAVNVFDTDQIRSFDFIRKEGEPTHLLTRYMLLKEYNTALEYNGTMINAINFATRNCRVSVGLLADVSVKAFVAANGWEFDLGYNFYFRHREKVCIKTECPCPIDSRIFGFKGLEGVCCATYTVNDTPAICGPAFSTAPLNATQANATMFNPELPNLKPEQPAAGISTICLSWNSESIGTASSPDCKPFSELTTPPYVEANMAAPQFVTCANLDPQSAAQGEMRTHKVFGHLSYTFDSCYTPFVGIGAEGEIDACNNNALQQWGIWIKAGASF